MHEYAICTVADEDTGIVQVKSEIELEQLSELFYYTVHSVN